MGIYDRDYYQPRQPGISLAAPRSIVVTLIIINVAAYLANGVLTPETNQITWWLGAHGDTLVKPWMWWQLLTYGFAHSPQFQHILFNMLGLWFLGRDIEHHYGRKEFLRLYLVMLVIGSLAWAIGDKLMGFQGGTVIGASGAIAGIVVLYALNFPRRTLLLFFVLPVPAWLVGVLVVLSDLFGAAGRLGDTHIAYTVHLAGAAFAFLYYHLGWNLTRLTQGRFSWVRSLKPQPKLKIHDPDQKQPELNKEVDRILEKIHRQGETSLTRKERRTLETASREYQKRQ